MKAAFSEIVARIKSITELMEVDVLPAAKKFLLRLGQHKFSSQLDYDLKHYYRRRDLHLTSRD